MKKYILILYCLFIFVNTEVKAQNGLYLEISSGTPQYFDSTEWMFNPDQQKMQRGFWGYAFICQGFHLEFECEDKQTKVQTIPLSSLSTYSFYTIPQLNNLLLPKTYAEQEAFFSSFDKTYLIEINQVNQTADIIEVRWVVIDM